MCIDISFQNIHYRIDYIKILNIEHIDCYVSMMFSLIIFKQRVQEIDFNRNGENTNKLIIRVYLRPECYFKQLKHSSVYRGVFFFFCAMRYKTIK